MSFKRKLRTLPSFSLQELLIVLVIIGILMLIAMPAMMPLITRARSIEAKQQLNFLHKLERTHYYEYSRYTAEMQKVGFQQETLVTDSETGQANYRVEILSADVTTFVAQATSVVDFDNDGNFNTWQINQDGVLTEVIPD